LSKERNDLTGEHTVGDIGQLVLACLFTVVWVGDTFLLRATVWLNAYLPLYIRIPLGIAWLALSCYLANSGLSIVFGETRETPAVITKGVCGVVRHPIYLSEILLYLGFLFLSASLAACVWVIAILFLHAISRYEEYLLLARFGRAYERHKEEVPMRVPRLRKQWAGKTSVLSRLSGFADGT
jgi:protein-S-isoprenylcysteine O-methyltransferase Ste14